MQSACMSVPIKVGMSVSNVPDGDPETSGSLDLPSPLLLSNLSTRPSAMDIYQISTNSKIFYHLFSLVVYASMPSYSLAVYLESSIEPYAAMVGLQTSGTASRGGHLTDSSRIIPSQRLPTSAFSYEHHTEQPNGRDPPLQTPVHALVPLL